MAELEAAFQSAEAEVEIPTPKAPEPSADEGESASKGEGGVAGQSIRVNVDVLENLMTMVSSWCSPATSCCRCCGR
jgi:two-component system chemotaxis sensor kinase CheA